MAWRMNGEVSEFTRIWKDGGVGHTSGTSKLSYDRLNALDGSIIHATPLVYFPALWIVFFMAS
jgi:hypothetical protein